MLLLKHNKCTKTNLHDHLTHNLSHCVSILYWRLPTWARLECTGLLLRICQTVSDRCATEKLVMIWASVNGKKLEKGFSCIGIYKEFWMSSHSRNFYYSQKVRSITYVSVFSKIRQDFWIRIKNKFEEMFTAMSYLF